MKTRQVLRGVFVVASFIAFIECEDNESRICPDATCADYSSQQQAQAAFDADPACFGELDHDSDGVACEHLSSGGGGGGSGCPTTSNCGCSNKNKDECASACCQWIVGTGCKCR